MTLNIILHTLVKMKGEHTPLTDHKQFQPCNQVLVLVVLQLFQAPQGVIEYLRYLKRSGREYRNSLVFSNDHLH